MKTIETAIDTVNKFGDTSTVFKLDLKDDNEYVPLDNKKVVLNVANNTGLVLTTPVTTFSGHTVMIDFSSPGLAELTPDTYNLEIEVTYSDGDVSKFPTNGGLVFNITNNLKETTGALVPTVTFDEVLRAVDVKVDEYVHTIAKGDKGDIGPAGPAGDASQGNNNTFTGKNTFTQPINGNTMTNEAKFTDFAIVAQNMNTYNGSWFVRSGGIKNGYNGNNVAYATITVISGNTTGTGFISYSEFLTNRTYNSVVDGGNIKGFYILANDGNVVHNSGNETIAGDKTLTGNSNFTGETTLKTGNYGLRVTKSGVQKTSDGGTTWVNI